MRGCGTCCIAHNRQGWDLRILPRCANSPGNGRFIRKNWLQRAHNSSAGRRQESPEHIQHKRTFDPDRIGKPLGKPLGEPPGDADQFEDPEQAGGGGQLPSQQLDVGQVDTDRHGSEGRQTARWPGSPQRLQPQQLEALGEPLGVEPDQDHLRLFPPRAQFHPDFSHLGDPPAPCGHVQFKPAQWGSQNGQWRSK